MSVTPSVSPRSVLILGFGAFGRLAAQALALSAGRGLRP